MHYLSRWLRFNWMYFRRPPWDTGIVPPELQEFIQNNTPGSAIDLGCGTGTNLLALAQADWQVTGVDFAPKAVRQARRKLAEAQRTGDIRVGDVTRLETVRGRYNLVLDIGCYHSLPESGRVAYRANLAVILESGGQYLVYGHWAQTGQSQSSGIAQDDVEAMRAVLNLEDRRDSFDRWDRPAVWMRFRRR